MPNSLFFNSMLYLRSSLFYNMSARQEQKECDTSDKSATRLQHEQQEWDTGNTSATQVLHKQH